MWLNILAVRKQPVVKIVVEHWKEFGRNFYTRHDYEEVDIDNANDLMKTLRTQLPSLVGQHGISIADDFSYDDPVDGSRTTGQGVRILFKDGSRVIYRLSGTGTAGATLRVYIEKYEADSTHHNIETQSALGDLIKLSRFLPRIGMYIGREVPTVIT
jgi:phosphoglucomutase